MVLIIKIIVFHFLSPHLVFIFYQSFVFVILLLFLHRIHPTTMIMIFFLIHY
jgi:hypothetical protein